MSRGGNPTRRYLHPEPDPVLDAIGKAYAPASVASKDHRKLWKTRHKAAQMLRSLRAQGFDVVAASAADSPSSAGRQPWSGR